ncbi:MAG: endonuclease/exonuclease/phosphatase family protein [Bdellovibrionota bacterium]
MPISVLSYNIHWGLSAFKKINVTDSLSTFIHKAKPDIILLQELWLPKGKLEYLIAETLKEVWPHQICVATCLLPLGNQGNGILSRHEILNWKHIDLSYSRHQSRSFVHARLWIEEEQKVLSLICTHFGLKRSERMFQAVVLADYIQNEIDGDEAIVLGGDFNDWRGEITQVFKTRAGLSEVFKETYGRHAKSYPALKPMLALDRMYVRGLQFEKPRVLKDAGWRGSSDHLPLAVDLRF